MAEKPRLFIALDIPDIAVDKVIEFQKIFKRAGIQARWVARENIHLTLKFLGETDSEIISAITEIIEYSIKDFEPFELSISNAGIFPDMTKPSIVWAGLTGETELVMKLSRIIDRSLLERYEIKIETKYFKPHITIARIKTKTNQMKLTGVIEDISVIAPFPFIAETVTLYKSTLTRDGAKYTALKSFKLIKKNY